MGLLLRGKAKRGEEEKKGWTGGGVKVKLEPDPLDKVGTGSVSCLHGVRCLVLQVTVLTMCR